VNLPPGQEDFSSAPGLRAGLFSDLSAGDTCPLRILDFHVEIDKMVLILIFV